VPITMTPHRLFCFSGPQGQALAEASQELASSQAAVEADRAKAALDLAAAEAKGALMLEEQERLTELRRGLEREKLHIEACRKQVGGPLEDGAWGPAQPWLSGGARGTAHVAAAPSG
jgi:hypothetical protein